MCEPNYNAVVNCFLFLQYGVDDESAMILLYAVLWIHSLLEYTQLLFDFYWMHNSHNSLLLLIILQGIAGATLRFQFLARFLDGLLKFLVLQVNEIDGAFHATTFASPSAWHSFPFSLRVLTINDLVWMWAVFSLISHRTTYIRLEVLLPIE